MIGAMPAVAVRHERRKKKSKDKRPKKLLLKPYQGGQNDGTMSPTTAHTSRGGSRAGSPTHGTQNGIYIRSLHHMLYFIVYIYIYIYIYNNILQTISFLGVEPEVDLDNVSVRYGDECFYGKASLLHFVIFFLLGGLTVLIVGLVQLKKEATLNIFK